MRVCDLTIRVQENHSCIKQIRFLPLTKQQGVLIAITNCIYFFLFLFLGPNVALFYYIIHNILITHTVFNSTRFYVNL